MQIVDENILENLTSEITEKKEICESGVSFENFRPVQYKNIQKV